MNPGWNQSMKAIALICLLAGEALSVYSEMAAAAYHDLQGQSVMTEEAHYTGQQLHQYKLRQLQTGEDVRVLFDDGQVNFLLKSKDRESTAREELRPNTLINDQLQGYLAERWSQVQAGESIPIRLVVPLRKETVGFDLVREREVEWQAAGAPSPVLAMRPANILVRLFVRPIFLTLDAAAPHALLRVEGRSSLKTPGLPQGDDLDTDLKFDR